MMRIILRLFAFIPLITASCNKEEVPDRSLELLQVFIGNIEIDLNSGTTQGLPTDRSIILVFSGKINQTSVRSAITLLAGQQPVNADVNVLNDGRTVTIIPAGVLSSNTVYTIVISDTLQGVSGGFLPSTEVSFKTAMADIAIVAARLPDREIGPF